MQRRGRPGPGPRTLPPMADETLTLWRPVGQAELELIAAAEWRRFPPRLEGQPIFYPVLNEDSPRRSLVSGTPRTPLQAMSDTCCDSPLTLRTRAASRLIELVAQASTSCGSRRRNSMSSTITSSGLSSESRPIARRPKRKRPGRPAS